MNKPKTFIFGAGTGGRALLPAVQQDYEVLGFIDNNPLLISSEVAGLTIFAPEKLLQTEFDTVIVGSVPGFDSIQKQLIEMGISRNKININYYIATIKSRINFLENVAQMFAEDNINDTNAHVAEGGVFQGESAKHINRVFPNKTFYLFDTFEGFSEKDVTIELQQNFSLAKAGHLANTSVETVLANLPHPEKCVIRKGYFPETAIGLENEQLCFVNLDFDLYKPTLAGLEFFVPRMVKGGIVLVDDVFGGIYNGVKQAMNEFSAKNTIKYLPVGDGYVAAFRI
ncbi:MAG: macrocin-O-methyltransferase [Defluviitaleaceae bacterium]|nr:macrocin-O-methyltransferase [Defluviitaleaceae bacterium]